MLNLDSVKKIIDKLKELEITFQQNQAMILTEDDLKCHVFRLIYDLFPISARTFSREIKGSAVHSEVSFFDGYGKLTLKPDLIVVEPKNISIFHSTIFDDRRQMYQTNSSKDYSIAGGSIVIELKFCRRRDGIQNRDITSYQADINKIKKIMRIVETKSPSDEKVYGILAVFNKTNNGYEIFEDFKNKNQTEDISIFYGTGNVDFSQSTQYSFR